MLALHRITRAVVLPCTALLAISCTDAPVAVDHAALHLDASAAKMSPRAVASTGLAHAVKAATSRFHSTVQATKAGYVVGSPCISAPPGGMGFHWVNELLVDAVFDPMQPEAVLYAPDRNGNLKLVAVEYIVIDVGQPHPSFAGHPFDIGGTPVPRPHYSLHAWVHLENPNGLHTPFNPAVTCPSPTPGS